ncbi:MAG: hypothetical protein WCH65_05315 [bacterium]
MICTLVCSTLSKENVARLGFSRTILSSFSSSISFSSSFCLTVFSSFLNHNHDKKPPQPPKNSSALRTLLVASFSLSMIVASFAFGEVLVFAGDLETTFLATGFAEADTGFEIVFGIEKKIT